MLSFTNQNPKLSLESACNIVDQGDLFTAYQLMQTNSFWYDAALLSNLWYKKLLEISAIDFPLKHAKVILDEIFRIKNHTFKSTEEVLALVFQKNEDLNIEYAELIFLTPCLNEKFKLIFNSCNNPLFTPCAMILELIYSARRISLLMENDSFDTVSFSPTKLEEEISKKHCPQYLKNQILSLAVMNQFINLANKALEIGANPNCFCFDYKLPRTMLQIAASQANVEMMKLLLKYGASINISTGIPEVMIFFPQKPITLLDIMQHDKMQNLHSLEMIYNFIDCNELIKDVDWTQSKFPIDQITKEQFAHQQYSEFLSHYYYRDEDKIEEKTNNRNTP